MSTKRTALAPQTALLLALEFAALTLLVERLPGLGLAAALAAAYAFASPRGRHRAGAVLLLAALGTWTVLLSQGLFYEGAPRTALLRLLPPTVFPLGSPPGLYLWREGLLYGLVQSLRFDVMILLGAGLLARYAADELTEGLRRLRLPAPLCFLFAMALRHLPLLAGEVRTGWAALRLRGLRPFGWRLLTPLAAGNLRRSDEVAAALLARGFSPLQEAPARLAPAPRRERVLCWLGLALLVSLAALQALARLHHLGSPVAPALEGVLGWVWRHV